MARPRRFTVDQVCEWRRAYEARLRTKSVNQLAREAGIGSGHMLCILKGRLYKDAR